MRDFRELNQEINEVKRILNRFIKKLMAKKLTAQVEIYRKSVNSLSKDNFRE